MNTRLDQFIRESLLKGISRTEITQALVSIGWGQAEVDSAMREYADKPFGVPIPMPSSFLYAGENLKHLIMYFALYLSVYSFGSLLYAFIDIKFPDPLNLLANNIDWIRGSTAALLVAFPLYLLLHFSLWKSMRRSVEQRQSRLRSWLTYLTMFIAATTIITNVIALVLIQLSGILTTRDELRSATVLSIAFAVLGYYVITFRRAQKALAGAAAIKKKGLASVVTETPFAPWAFFSVVVFAYLVVVGYGMYFSSHPSTIQLASTEEMQVTNLKKTTQSINSYWNTYTMLPATLDGLMQDPHTDPDHTFYTDPATQAIFDYAKIDQNHFQLCAQFAAQTQTTGPIFGGNSDTLSQTTQPVDSIVWTHFAGLSCFNLQEVGSPMVPMQPSSSTPDVLK